MRGPPSPQRLRNASLNNHQSTMLRCFQARAWSPYTRLAYAFAPFSAIQTRAAGGGGQRTGTARDWAGAVRSTLAYLDPYLKKAPLRPRPADSNCIRRNGSERAQEHVSGAREPGSTDRRRATRGIVRAV
jgi:hypothetical protein